MIKQIDDWVMIDPPAKTNIAINMTEENDEWVFINTQRHFHCYDDTNDDDKKDDSVLINTSFEANTQRHFHCYDDEEFINITTDTIEENGEEWILIDDK